MKINVTCIYWFLLLISCVSSCLLFILVASESVKTTSAYSEIASDVKENAAAEIDRYEGGEKDDGAVTPDINTINTGAEVTTPADLRTSFDEEIPATDAENAEANKEFVISQNSGLSDGLSDTGQAVVYTLVDTASAELKQRADTIPTTHITQSFNEAPNVSTSSSLNFTPTILVQPPPTTAENNDIGALENTANTPEVPPNIPEDPKANISSPEDDNTNTQTPPKYKEDYIVRAKSKIITTKEETVPPSQPQPAVVPQNKTSPETDLHIPTIEVANKSEDKDPVKEENEDIPSFSEWTQKQLEEAEKKKEKVNTSAQNQQSSKPSSNLKLRSKNYASPDCGAKIVAANPEAMYAGSVLSPSRDEYKLNTCTSRIWFIVELCEAIQAKKIDLANFELFSSSPKDFTVSVSDRFPSRDWSSVGHFQAKDERDIQSFNLHPHLFGKFIKVEMLSHWGSEHFCPISLFRVYGTSEFEVLETEDQVEASSDESDDDDDDEETLDSYTGEHTNNLFGSARDAVMSIVKKAAEVLVKSGDKSNQTLKNDERIHKYSPLINTCSTPSHLVVCDNCSDILFGKVYELLSCHRQFLHDLINLSVMNKSLYNTNICVQFGFNFFSKSIDNTTDSNCGYISSFLAPKYIAALCNVLAVIENKVVLNVSNQYTNASNSINNTLVNNLIDLDNNNKVVPDIIPAPTYQAEESEVKTCASQQKTEQTETKTTVIIEDSFVETVDIQIKPTKTLSKDGKVSSPLTPPETTEETTTTKRDINLDPSEIIQLPKVENTSSMEEENKINTQDQTDVIKNEDKTVTTSPQTTTTSSVIAQQDSSVTTTINAAADSAENFEIGHDQLDKLLSELNLDSDGHTTSSQTTAAPPNAPQQQQQKESVFLRLSNRIKALERNMSLSGQYLEELSRRYKKQVEDMQRAFEKKLTLITEENKKREERELRLQQKIDKLTNSVENLLTEKDSMWKTASLLGQFLLMEVFVTCILLYFCWKTPEGTTAFQRQRKKSGGTVEVKRRKSIDTIGHESPVVHRKRRPSEEALKITGTYEDLLITDEAGMTKAEKRRRRKKNALHRSQSAVACKLPQVSTTTTTEEPTRRASSSDMNRKPTFLGTFQPNYVNGDLSPPAKIEEIPFVLEESEHTAVEPLDYFPIDVNKTDTISADFIKTSLNKITKNGSIKSSILKSHSPIFKTALSSRNKRNSTSSTKRLSLFKTDISQNSSQSRKSQSPDPSIQNSYSVSDSQDDQTSLNSDTSKKDKKLSGFKRMFKRVFE